MNMPRVLQVYLTMGILAAIAFISGFLVCRKVAREDDGSPGGSSSSHRSTAIKAFYVDSLRHTHLLGIGHFCLSPDGGSLAYDDEDDKLRVTTLKEVMHLERDMEFPGRILARGFGQTPNVGGISWSPNGKEIAYSLTSVAGSLNPTSTIYCANVLSRKVQPISPGDYPSWSPDSTRLVFTRGYQLVIRDIALQKDAVVVSGKGEFREIQSPAWSPDGKKIAFTRGHELVIRDMALQKDAVIVSEEGKSREIQWPTWSPDGRKIAYTVGYLSSLYVVDIRTKKVRCLAALPLGGPCYSPKGKWILAEEYSFLAEWAPEHFESVGGGRLYLVSSRGDRVLPLMLREQDKEVNGELGELSDGQWGMNDQTILCVQPHYRRLVIATIKTVK